jgi:hypothetical protein
MSENEEYYLQQCLQKMVCPSCQKKLTNKVGSGRFKDGVFCSQDCYAKWHSGVLIKRHQERLNKGNNKENNNE